VAVSRSKHDPWKLGDFALANDEASDFDAFIELPIFQRSLVWSEKQKIALIDSIYRGFPIGAILAYQSRTKGDKVYLQMVDGLQRMTAIRDYLERPLYFAPVDCLFSGNFINQLSRIKFGNAEDDNLNSITTDIQKWLQATEKPLPNKGWQFDDFKSKLSNGDADLLEKLDSLSSLFYDEITVASNKIMEISVTEIPVIKYLGPIENIPTIFERINNQGTKLSKYEIFASSWIKSATWVKSSDIHEAVKKKYNVHIENNYVISDYDPSKPIAEDAYNLYEYLFGLGKVLSNEFPLLFESSSEPDDVTPIAFVLYTIALGMPLADMKNLATNMPRKNSDLINPTAIEAALRDSIRQINNQIEPYLKVKLNSTSNKRQLPHSQNQIISLITAYLVHEYDSEWKKTNSAAAKKILENASTHYLFDIIRGTWGGSGDSRLFRMTWNEDNSKSHYYVDPVPENQFRESLNSWFDDSLKKNQKERSSISSSVRAVLLFLYAHRIVVHDDAKDLYEIEHIYPVAHIAEIIKETSSNGWPISALGNLMLLPQEVNRIKGKDLLGDVLPDLLLDGTVTEADVTKIKKYLVEPKDWHSITANPRVTREGFLEFCRARHSAIEEILIDKLTLESQ
jgi:hypothetical protein